MTGDFGSPVGYADFWEWIMPAINVPSVGKLQAKCDRFNAKVNLGDEVFVKFDGVDEPFRTRTRSVAQILGGHSAVIWLENVAGCYLLDRVESA